MEILIKPTLNNVQKDMGYEDFEDVNEDSLLFQQGYDAYPEDIEDDEIFEIPEGFVGQILDESPYYMPVEIFENEWEDEEIEGDIMAGRYRLKGNKIISLD